jgi:ATP-dependent exoDNAse (exonuclease V) beta subunit
MHEGPSILYLLGSAGAGKTHNLAKRYLYLLCQEVPESLRKDHLRSLLAITFTNKAAQEMKERIIRYLKENALGIKEEVNPDLARSWIEFILLNYSYFQIKTIDSLLFTLLRGLLLELGGKPELEVTFDQKEVINRSFDRLLSKMNSSDELRGLFQEVIHCFLKVEKRAGFKIEKYMRKRLFELFSMDEATPKEALSEGNLPAEISRDPLKLEAWQKLRPYRVILSFLRDEVKELITKEGIILGGQWTKLLKELFEQSDLSYALFKVGFSVKHVMLDEFQDTNEEQWEILKEIIEDALARGGTLFFVGDPKQAIYGWRGGNWRLMEKAFKEDFPSVPQERRRKESLRVNYRSGKEIVQFSNKLCKVLSDPYFGKFLLELLFPKEKPLKKGEFLKRLREIFADQDQECSKEEGGLVNVELIRVNKKEELLPNIRERLVKKVKEKFQAYPKGIAILVRKNADGEEIAQWLSEEEIPVVTENSLRLRRTPLLKGLVSLLRFLDWPGDELALWSALKSGIFHDLEGFPAQRLEDLLEMGKGKEGLRKILQIQFPEGFKKYVESLLEKVGFLSPYEVCQQIMRTLRLFERFQEGEDILRRFLELVHKAERLGIRSLSEFLEFWDEEGGEERIGTPEGVKAVRILTIHKAKGLEFPIVFIPLTDWSLEPQNRNTIKDEKGELFYITAKSAPPDLLELRKERQFSTLIESLNLFYVGATRAMEECHVYVGVYPRQKRERKYFSLILQEILKRITTEYGF